MLPDFARVKRKRELRFRRLVRRECEKRTPFLQKIRAVQQHEGSRIEYTTVHGEQDQVTWDKPITSNVQFRLSELPRMNEAWYRDQVVKLAQNIAPQQMQMLLRKADEACEKAGTVTHTGGKPFDPMMLIESLRKTEIDFDENGHPILQDLLVPPGEIDAVKDAMDAAWQSPEFRCRWEELMNQKWTEYRVREADRKLVE